MPKHIPRVGTAQRVLQTAGDLLRWSITPNRGVFWPVLLGAAPAYFLGEDSLPGGIAGGLLGAMMARKFGPIGSLGIGLGLGYGTKKYKQWKRRREREKRLRQLLAMQMQARMLRGFGG